MGISRKSGLPVGTIVPRGHVETSGGYLPCDGTPRLIASYPRLAAKWGTTYGGDGVTTFGVIDMRANSLRGLDQGRGVDAARALGTEQAGQSNNIRNIITGLVGDSTTDTGDFPEDGNYSPLWAMTGDEGASPNWHVKGRLWGRETRTRNMAVPFYVKT